MASFSLNKWPVDRWRDRSMKAAHIFLLVHGDSLLIQVDGSVTHLIFSLLFTMDGSVTHLFFSSCILRCIIALLVMCLT
jgi:hypothetical protein